MSDASIYDNPLFGIQERMANMDINATGPTMPTYAATGPEPVLPTETEAERIARLDREAEDDRRKAELDFAQKQADLQTAQRKQDARSTMAAVLATYGLGDLADYVYNEIIAKETVNINNPDAIIFAIREQPAYQKRFAGNAARMKAGLPELSPGEYIGLEDQYKQVVRSNGLPAGFYDTTDDITKLISGDVSPSEFQSRIANGYNAVANADPEVRQQMQDLYGISEGHLAAYFLDPTRGEPLLQQQVQAAKIAARGLESGGMQLSKATAEDLAARGITEGQAQQGFGNIGQLGELTTQMAGETGLTQEQIVGQEFGYDTQAALELAKRARRRVGEFAGGGDFVRTQGQTSGAIQTAFGTAQ
jgi:hypothetical protein